MGKDADEKREQDCMVCGEEIEYLSGMEEIDCHYCGRVFKADARCRAGHYVCDGCHSEEALDVIKSICLSTKETDMIALLERARAHRAIPMHGPEHHALVPGVILATYRNLGGEATDEMIVTAVERGSRVPGGFCGWMGSCGAALGVGNAFGVIMGSTPLEPEKRMTALRITSDVLARLGKEPGARCCQRDCWTALKAAAELSEKYLPIRLKADYHLDCAQSTNNRECLFDDCPVMRGD